MKHLLTPKLDLVFKLLFTTDTDLLLDLINAVLDFPKHLHIRSIEVKNPVVLPEEITEKLIILDILAVDESAHQYDIEMQVRRYAFYAERTLYYLARMYSNQLDAGEKYERLKPVIGIHFLDYEAFPGHPDGHFCFELRDVRYPELLLTDDLSLHIFELPKLKKGKQAEQWGEKMYEWLHFFNHAHEEGDETMRTRYTNPIIHKAFNVLETLSADEETRLQVEIREKALKNALSELAAAREEGREEGELIGAIRTLQRILKHSINPKEELVQRSMKDLKKMLQELESELN